MPDPALLLVAHGTRNPRGVEMIARLADAVADRVGTTRVAFVDVLGPSPAEALREIRGPVVLVPAFLASGYHVHNDVPREVAESGHRAVAVTRALGPDPALAGVLVQRLREAGWRPGDAIVLAAAGSSDPRARHDVQRAAHLLSVLTFTPVRIGYVATGEPRVPQVVAESRQPGVRVFVASYLLAEGLFHSRLSEAGADGVAAPLGVTEPVVDLVARRYRAAVPTLRAGAGAQPNP
ncbi:sirohydrochlorin chelatase [Rhodococcus coprophilus]|uniref:Cobalamin biosynthesis protein n=1 Tax=Rhodococcus coprophilus TaxID=38310 RepID=A0A2X4V041_9NOCA|nr:sirohydrochlorin chelatase [Rhodococcus coprophilus]MBM7460158.1 sirohydrochlorin ferrochelatase [Rhodococcus coprophilus]SQI38670.1 cobalamin biosynthesis protein [Rhodococcus coprophilus]